VLQVLSSTELHTTSNLAARHTRLRQLQFMRVQQEQAGARRRFGARAGDKNAARDGGDAEGVRGRAGGGRGIEGGGIVNGFAAGSPFAASAIARVACKLEAW